MFKMERNMDDVGGAFQCHICLDGVYKPAVPACGHVFCLGCLLKAMSSYGTSRCPVCRNSYQHLPGMCELLHYLLLKAFPKEYEKRAEEVSEWERERGTFSPQLGALDSNGQEDEALESEKDKDISFHQMGTRDLNAHSTGTSISERKLRISDALCAHCKELIYRPVILNCGHAFCESCVSHNVSQGTTHKCHVCQISHPAKSWSVCLELHHFLQSMFPVEYEGRERAILVQNKQPKKKSPTDEIAETSSETAAAVHVCIGCDNCGLFPILGKRYRCKDCRDIMGFDLCETCYKSQAGACIVGRFNQHHKAEHQFEVVAKRRPRRFILLDAGAGLFI